MTKSFLLINSFGNISVKDKLLSAIDDEILWLSLEKEIFLSFMI